MSKQSELKDQLKDIESRFLECNEAFVKNMKNAPAEIRQKLYEIKQELAALRCSMGVDALAEQAKNSMGKATGLLGDLEKFVKDKNKK